MARLRRCRTTRGMSLVEVMVGIAIITALSAMLTIGIMQVWSDARVRMSWLTVNRVANDVVIHETTRGRVPEHLRDVYRHEPIPKDAWSHDVELHDHPDPWDVVSWGADGVEGGTGSYTDLRYSERHLR